MFEILPLEIKFQILLYCPDDVLLLLSSTNHFYYHLIFKIDEKEDELNNELNNYNKLLWLNRCKDILNKYIGDCNNEIVNNNLNIPFLLKIETNNQLLQYFTNNFMQKNLSFIEIYKFFKNIKFELNENNNINKNSYKLQNNTCRNIQVEHWLSFYGSFKLNFMKGFEIIINEYYECYNTWRIVIGFGLKRNTFNSDSSRTEFTVNNKGIGLILESCGFAGNGQMEPCLHGYEPAQKGYRYTVYLDWKVNNCAYFLQNGKVITKVDLEELDLEKEEIYPIISLTSKKTCSIYPLLKENYDPLKLEEECKLLSMA
ncbi:hypothetical protein ABK040_015199 [Willaertia magna]